MKDKSIQFRISEADVTEIKYVSEKLDVSASQLAREAIREKIAVLKKTDPRLQEESETIAA